MNKITLQDIINKKLNTCGLPPDDMIAEAYCAITNADMSPLSRDKTVTAYITARTAIEANKACGISVPNIEIDMLRMKKECCLDSDQEIADYYMEHLDK